MKRMFFGGIHPQYNKEMSQKNTALQEVNARQVIIPMQQHIGVPCPPLVSVGDRVKRGEKIGDGEGLCVPVHASVSGTVTEIKEAPHPTLGRVTAIVIENDFQDECAPFTPPNEEDEEETLAAIREAGIVGMGGAAFPGNKKALAALGNIDTLIANGCECEPYITADDFLMRTKPEAILSGMRILFKLLHPARTVLAIEDNKPEAIKAVRACLKDFPEITLQILPTRYPQGAEKQLIQSVTGREVPSGNLPMSVGCAVFNVATFSAVSDAVQYGKPLTERIVTVSGAAVNAPQNFLVRIGTPLSDLIDAAGGTTEHMDRVICGGPMMGTAQTDFRAPIVKAVGAVLCLPKNRDSAAENPVCLRCGKCIDVCPMRLQPLYLYRYIRREDIDRLARLHIFDCMECGCCSYICPGKVPLTETFKKGKALCKEVREK